MPKLIDLEKIKPIEFPSTEMDGLDVVRYLNTLPTVDAVEVVHGHWIEHSHLEVGGECSVCGWQFQWFENNEAHYCPHCGAKMDGVSDG